MLAFYLSLLFDFYLILSPLLVFLASGFKVLAPKDATTEEKFNHLKSELHGLLQRLLPDLKFEVCAFLKFL
jgi:hypothetical protein